MKIDRYFVFPDLAAATAFSEAVNAGLGDTWDQPNEHPFDERTLIGWNDDHLAHLKYLTEGLSQISRQAAEEEGWVFGQIRGRFAKARLKLEEAQLLQEALVAAGSEPNFPVYRALFFGFLSATYAVKEAIRRVCAKLGPDAETWWAAKFEGIKADPLLCFFYDLNNAEKHEISASPLKPYLHRVNQPLKASPPEGSRLVVSRDGVHALVKEGTQQERRVYVPGADVLWDVLIETETGPNGRATELAEQVLHFYEALVFEARTRFERP